MVAIAMCDELRKQIKKFPKQHEPIGLEDVPFSRGYSHAIQDVVKLLNRTKRQFEDNLSRSEAQQ
jgi:hypothetical protein